MTEHTFDYMSKDGCAAWQFSKGTCCPAGTHKHDCGYIQGHNNERQSHAPKRPNWIDFVTLTIAFSLVAYAVLERILA